MLNVNNIEVIYDDVILVLKGLSTRGQRRPDRSAARCQRCRQNHDPEGHLGIIES